MTSTSKHPPESSPQSVGPVPRHDTSDRIAMSVSGRRFLDRIKEAGSEPPHRQ